MLQGGFLVGGVISTSCQWDYMELLLELFDELAELLGEAVHGPLEAGQSE